MRRLISTAAAVACAALLSGCGGSPEAGPAPTPRPSSTAPSPTASAAATPPEQPAEAQRPGRRGADAFVRHYVDVLNFAGQSGETGALDRIAAKDCVRCAALVDGINDIYRSGGRIEGGGWRITDVRHYGSTNGRYFVDVVIDSSPQVLYRADGKREEFEGTSNRLRAFVLERRADEWFVAELDPTA